MAMHFSLRINVTADPDHKIRRGRTSKIIFVDLVDFRLAILVKIKEKFRTPSLPQSRKWPSSDFTLDFGRMR